MFSFNRKSARGATMMQYSMVLGLIAAVALAATTGTGGSLKRMLTCVAARIEGSVCPVDGAGGSGAGGGAGSNLAIAASAGNPSAMAVAAPGSPAYGSPVTATVSNTGSGASAPLALALSNPSNFEILQDQCSGQVLAAGATCTVQVRPKSAGNGTLAGQLCLTVGNTPCLALSGTAAGFTVPALSLTVSNGSLTAMNVAAPGSPAYGNVVSLTLTNAGTTPSAPVALNLSNTTNFDLPLNQCAGVQLAAGASCTIAVRPRAAGNGALAGELCVTGDSKPCVSMSGTASGFTVANLAFSAGGDPAAMNVLPPGNPAYGASMVFTVANTGGTPSAALSPSLTNLTNFEITVNTCAGATLAGGASCQIYVRPKASADGALSGQLCLANDNAPCIALSGTAMGFSSALLGFSSASSMTAMNVSAPGNPAFGNTIIVALTNNGGVSAAATSVSLSSATNFEIVINQCNGASLAGGGGSCQLYIRPKASVNGAFSAQLCATGSNAPCTTLSGTASGFSSASLTFGSGYDMSAMNVSAPGNPAYGGVMVVALTNNGGLASSATSITLSNPTNFDLPINNCNGATLAGGGGSCQIYVRSKASANGTITAQLCATNDNAPCLTLTATASGFTPANLGFSSGSNLSAMNVTGPGNPAYGGSIVIQLTNSGGVSSSAIGISLTNTANFDMPINQCANVSLGGGASCQIYVRPRTSANGPITTQLCASANNNPCVTLSGTGSGF